MTASHIDAALFLGMNSADEATRIACKSFFAARITDKVTISLEQVGRCDDLVWRFPRHVQDAYYPFMDNLHTDMDIERLGYTRADLDAGLGTPELTRLPLCEQLLASMVLNRQATLYTASPRLLALTSLPVRAPDPGPELPFPERLEGLYRASLVLRIPSGELCGEG